jgi:hypothetical protein
LVFKKYRDDFPSDLAKFELSFSLLLAWSTVPKRVQIQKEMITDLKRQNQFFVKRDMAVYITGVRPQEDG